jgi:hypothetical protein
VSGVLSFLEIEIPFDSFEKSVAKPVEFSVGRGGLGVVVRAGLVNPPSLVRTGASASDIGCISGLERSACVSKDSFR